MVQKITTQKNGQHMYARIQTASRDMSVLLSQGMTPALSLLASAREMRLRAEKLASDAQFIEDAAGSLAAVKSPGP